MKQSQILINFVKCYYNHFKEWQDKMSIYIKKNKCIILINVLRTRLNTALMTGTDDYLVFLLCLF